MTPFSRLARTLNLSACILALTACSVLAGPPSGRPGPPPAGAGMHGQMPAFLDDLHLTAAQQAKIQQMGQQMTPKLMALRQDASLSPQVKQAKMIAMQKAMQKQFMAILTPAQQAKIKAKMNARMKAMQNGKMGGRPGMGGGGMRP